MFKLHNEFVSIEVSPVGAELTSLYSPVTELEYLWQPGYETWPHHSMLLFPNPGRIAHDRTVIGGKVYPATMHGFANDMTFSLVEQTEDCLVLELRDNEQTRKYYPYAFALRVEFALEGDKVIQTFRVINRDDKPVYYCLGAHPGFYCPLVLGEKPESYSLVFDRPQNMDLMELEENTRLLTGKAIPWLQQEQEIPLHEGFFNEGPKLFGGMDAGTLTLKGQSGRFVELGVEGFPSLCLWGVPTRMSLIAIEPWIGTSDRVDTDHVWETKPGVQMVAVGEEKVHKLTFRVG